MHPTLKPRLGISQYIPYTSTILKLHCIHQITSMSSPLKHTIGRARSVSIFYIPFSLGSSQDSIRITEP